MYPGSLVKEFVWCPVAAWLAVNTGVRPLLTPRMVEGLDVHGRLREILSRFGFGDARLLPPLRSRRWPLVCSPDAYSPSRRAVVEVKVVAGPWKRLYRIQALVYGFVAFENGLHVERVALLEVSRGKVLWFDLDWGAYETVDKIVWRMVETVEKPLPPPVSQPPAKCLACRWRRWCPERCI